MVSHASSLTLDVSETKFESGIFKRMGITDRALSIQGKTSANACEAVAIIPDETKKLEVATVPE